MGGHIYYCHAGGTGTASNWAKLSGALAVPGGLRLPHERGTDLQRPDPYRLADTWWGPGRRLGDPHHSP